ncbi:putative chloramphenical resistance permease RarD [uncultured Eubacterium sp.]|nr:putative chloramphenical resistance permease RarD [uncultured Eubacterium sp.]
MNQNTGMVGRTVLQNRKGIVLALTSYIIWGVMPLYWQELKPVDSWVIIFYRIVLVAVVSFIGAIKTDGWDEIKSGMKPRGAKALFFLAGVFITANWSLYVWAVNAGFVIQTSIGHYLEPLMIAGFGMVLFKEKASKNKFIAFGLAGAGVLVMIVHFGEVPIIAVGLGSTFAIYAAIKKKLSCSSMLSLFYETIFFVPAALIIIIYLECTGRGALSMASPAKYLLLMTVGLVTVIVLWLFAEAETKTSLSNIGLIAYIAPTISLLLGIFWFQEPFDLVQLCAFGIIWLGLIIFTIGEFRTMKK